jgi:hypothetical protein
MIALARGLHPQHDLDGITGGDVEKPEDTERDDEEHEQNLDETARQPGMHRDRLNARVGARTSHRTFANSSMYA